MNWCDNLPGSLTWYVVSVTPSSCGPDAGSYPITDLTYIIYDNNGTDVTENFPYYTITQPGGIRLN